jgi:dTDP-4-amino-4,6-dideoxygalactose transaminase
VRVQFVNLGAQFDSLRKPILSAIERISQQGAYVLSDEVEQFEQGFAQYCGVEYALGVANGTDALMLPMKALGIGRGDEVITAPNSFIATAGAIAQVGATPIFVDVTDDFNIDVSLIEKAITPRTRAIIPVHLTGMPANMDGVLDIAEARNLHVIEDAAQAVGAYFRGKRVGSFGTAAGFSLHPLKTLHVQGDGGVLTLKDEDLYRTLKQLRNHGLRSRDECDSWGFNSRLDAIQAAIANIKLEHLDDYTMRMREIAAYYTRSLEGIVTLPVEPPGCEGIFHNYIIMTERRDELQAYLLERQIETKIHYPIPLHLQKAAASLGYKRGDFPVAESQASRILSLPIYPELLDEQIEFLVDTIRAFYA